MRLEPCPDYTMVKQGSWDDMSVARYALNCAAVSTPGMSPVERALGPQ